MLRERSIMHHRLQQPSTMLWVCPDNRRIRFVASLYDNLGWDRLGNNDLCLLLLGSGLHRRLVVQLRRQPIALWQYLLPVRLLLLRRQPMCCSRQWRLHHHRSSGRRHRASTTHDHIRHSRDANHLANHHHGRPDASNHGSNQRHHCPAP